MSNSRVREHETEGREWYVDFASSSPRGDVGQMDSQVSCSEGTIRKEGELYRDFASSSPRDDAGQLDSQVSSPEGTIRRDGESYRDFASSSPRDDAGPRGW